MPHPPSRQRHTLPPLSCSRTTWHRTCFHFRLPRFRSTSTPPSTLIVCLLLLFLLHFPQPAQSQSSTPPDNGGASSPPPPVVPAPTPMPPATLGGRKLHCCAMLQYPNLYVSKFKSRGLDGMAMKYLEDLEDSLNFTCAVLEVMTVRFTAFILAMERCRRSPSSPNSTTVESNDGAKDNLCRCELGVGGWMLTQQRLGRVHYLPPFVRDDMRVVTHVDNTYTSTTDPFFISTFTPAVWAAMAGLVASWTFLKVLDKRFIPPDSSFKPLSRDASWFKRKKHIVMKSNLPRRLRKSFQSTAGRMIGHVDESVESVQSSSTRQWSLNFIILLCGLFFALIYEATMTSIEDLRQCVIDPQDVCVVRGGAVNSFWNAITADEGCHKGKNATLVSSYEGAIDMVGNKSCKYLLVDGSTARLATNVRYCRKVVSTGDPVYPASNSFVVPLGSDLYFPLSNGTLKLLEEGRLESLEDYFERRGQCTLSESTTITFNKLRIFFISAYVVTLILFFEMILDPQQVEPMGREVSPPLSSRNRPPGFQQRDDGEDVEEGGDDPDDDEHGQRDRQRSDRPWGLSWSWGLGLNLGSARRTGGGGGGKDAGRKRSSAKHEQRLSQADDMRGDESA